MKSDKPMISVIMPTYKSAKYLKRSLMSIVEQTYENFEVIIVDDTTEDDGTKDIIDAINDRRITYYKPAVRLGMVKSLNYAIESSCGQFIARMDADDISHKERFERQVDYLNNNPDVGVVGSCCYTIDGNDRAIGSINHPTEDGDIKSKMLFNVALIHPSVMMRREVVSSVLYDNRCYCCEDYVLWSRIMGKTKFHNLSEKLFKYRVLNDGAMQSQLSKLHEDSDYYRKHLQILKMAYNNVLDYYGVSGSDLSEVYEDMLFAKKIDDIPIIRREQFLHKCKELLTKRNDSRYVNACISYQWVKMTKSQFWRTKDLRLLFRSVMVIMAMCSRNISAMIFGILSCNRESNDWRV